MINYIKIQNEYDLFILETTNIDDDLMIDLASQSMEHGYSFKTSTYEEWKEFVSGSDVNDEAFYRWDKLIQW